MKGIMLIPVMAVLLIGIVVAGIGVSNRDVVIDKDTFSAEDKTLFANLGINNPDRTRYVSEDKVKDCFKNDNGYGVRCVEARRYWFDCDDSGFTELTPPNECERIGQKVYYTDAQINAQIEKAYVFMMGRLANNTRTTPLFYINRNT